MTENYLYKLVHSDIIANIWRSLLWMKVWSSFSEKLLRLTFPKWHALHGAHYPVFTRPFWLFAREGASWLRTPVLLVTSLHFVWTRKPPTATGEAARVSKDQERRIPAGLSLWYFGHLTWCHKVRSPKLRLLPPSAGCSVHRSSGHMLAFVRGWLSNDKLQEDTLCGSIYPRAKRLTL